MMKLTFRMTALTVAVVCLAANSAMGATIAKYNLGEDDAGAFAGFAGIDPTVDAVGSNDLTKFGDPIYSSDVPAGGSTLSMAFDGDGDYYSGPAPTTDVANNISYSFDAKMEARGAAGFSFLASLGSNFGGISVVEIGGNVTVFFPGAGSGDAGFQPDSEWHNYQVDWDAFNQVATLSVDGGVVSTRLGATANGQITDALTLGGNSRSADPQGAPESPPFEGSFNGLIDNFELSTSPAIPEPGSIVLLGLAGTGIALVARRRK
ncbi:MAG: LamG domain-containing protein [Bythopirellula sp.]